MIKLINWLKKLLERVILFVRRSRPVGSGIIPQTYDARDYQYVSSGESIELSVDLSDNMNKVWDQGSSNACTSFAVVDLLDYYLENVKKVAWLGFHSSQLFIWYFSRYEEGTQTKNVGVSLRSVFSVIKKYGFVPYEEHPFSNDWYNAPSEHAIISGDMFKMYLGTLPGYFALNTSRVNFVDTLKDCLSNGFPVVFGFPIRNELRNCKRDSSFIDNLSGSVSGYHAMLIVGYSDGYFKIKNSWGNKWGSRGFCYISESLIKEEGFDFWTLK